MCVIICRVCNYMYCVLGCVHECVCVSVDVCRWMCVCVYVLVCLCVSECVCVCVCVWVYVCVCVYVCTYAWACERVCRCACVLCMYGCIPMYLCVCVSMSVWLRVTANTDSFMQSELKNKRFRIVFVVDPIHWQFEDRPMRWSGDPFRFMHDWGFTCTQKYKISEFRIKSASTQYYRYSKWLCRSWSTRRD